MSVDELTDSDPDEAEAPLCPRCGQPINREWEECELCGQTLTEAKR
jgi:predicted amidophosphoribosyltransferase